MSTAISGILKSSALTTFAVFTPTPGRVKRSSFLEGITPLNFKRRILALSLMFLALFRNKPIDLIMFSISSIGASDNSSNVLNLLNNTFVTLFTATSVVCALKITAKRSS